MKKHSKFISATISAERKRFNNPYAFLDGNGDYDAIIYNLATNNTESIAKTKHSHNAEIEKKARELQLSIWNDRHNIWPNGAPSDPVDLLDPVTAIQYIGYDYDQPDFLGEFYSQSNKSDIAGMIDRSQKRISISDRLPIHTHRFTAAHELGHALLHQNIIMHRDRPIDGSNYTSEPREQMEIEADKFAAAYLMPTKLIAERFRMIFNTDVFILSDDTAYALDPTNSADLINKCNTLHDLARILAKAEFYNGNHVTSLAKQFRVSFEAMAIRIKELRLIKYK